MITRSITEEHMKYDPILMMNVPDTVRTTDASRGHEIVVKTEEEEKKLKVKDAEVAWQEFNSKDQPVTKRKSFSSQEAMEKFIEKISEKDNFYKILGTRDAASVLDKVINTCDIKANQVYVDETDYELSHRKRPSGTGMWIFGIGSKDMSAWKEFYGTYSQVKKQAMKVAAERNIKWIFTMG